MKAIFPFVLKGSNFHLVVYFADHPFVDASNGYTL